MVTLLDLQTLFNELVSPYYFGCQTRTTTILCHGRKKKAREMAVMKTRLGFATTYSRGFVCHTHINQVVRLLVMLRIAIGKV